MRIPGTLVCGHIAHFAELIASRLPASREHQENQHAYDDDEHKEHDQDDELKLLIVLEVVLFHLYRIAVKHAAPTDLRGHSEDVTLRKSRCNIRGRNHFANFPSSMQKIEGLLLEDRSSIRAFHLNSVEPCAEWTR